MHSNETSAEADAVAPSSYPQLSRPLLRSTDRPRLVLQFKAMLSFIVEREVNNEAVFNRVAMINPSQNQTIFFTSQKQREKVGKIEIAHGFTCCHFRATRRVTTCVTVISMLPSLPSWLAEKYCYTPGNFPKKSKESWLSGMKVYLSMFHLEKSSPTPRQ